MIVRVATSNPMKVEATREAFARFFKDADIRGVEVASAVSPQPKLIHPMFSPQAKPSRSSSTRMLTPKSVPLTLA